MLYVHLCTKGISILEKEGEDSFLTRISPNERICRNSTMKIVVKLLVIVANVQLNNALNVVQ
jgi:hypothetical protein